jgi:hypothetical protein
VGERGKLVWLSWLLHLTYLKIQPTSSLTTNALLGNKTKEKFKFGHLPSTQATKWYKLSTVILTICCLKIQAFISGKRECNTTEGHLVSKEAITKKVAERRWSY